MGRTMRVAGLQAKLDSIRSGRVHIATPWGDDSVRLAIPPDSGPLIEALNAVRLPPRFTALWHADSRDMEFIFTAQPVGREITERGFTFDMAGAQYRCDFSPASKRLLEIARCFEPAGRVSATGWRNLADLMMYARLSGGLGSAAQPVAATSFWIRDLQFDEEAVHTLATNLNFYMSYFDLRSPRILVHDPVLAGESVPSVNRFPLGEFPKRISGHVLDRYALDLWHSARDAQDSFRQFLFYYQILEYISFYQIKQEILESVRRVLLAPNMHDRLDAVCRNVIDAMQEDRTEPYAKLNSLLKKAADPAVVWRQIEPLADYFSCEMAFEGGVKLAPLLKAGWGAADFSAAWVPAFPQALRDLRNALVHARESRQVGTIPPTRRNYRLLSAWVGPIAVCAMQVMNYSSF
ncbi:MAG TPA: hypothetical protein VNE39_28485 [Planctomycetota bacterium]|nr:hypothetical protein [Planctomycetota bacterium]